MGRIKSLDGLRACAVLAVIAYHYAGWGLPAPAGGLHYLLWKLAQTGWMGVNLFFVLSGFLITGLLLDRRDEPQRILRFYLRRGLRILPPYVLTLAILLITRPDAPSYVLLSAFFLSNFAELFQIKVSHSSLWSLSVEEHFYLFWPWLCFGFTRGRLIGACVAICLLCPAIRAARLIFDWPNGFFTWFWLDSLAWGGLLALFLRGRYSAHLGQVAWGGLATAAVALLAGAPFGLFTRTSLLGTTAGSTVIALTAAAAIAFCLARPASAVCRLLATAPFQYIGALSYGLYLYHGFFLELSGFTGTESGAGSVAWRFIVGFSASLAMAHLSYYGMEKKFLTYKDRALGETPRPLRAPVTAESVA